MNSQKTNVYIGSTFLIFSDGIVSFLYKFKNRILFEPLHLIPNYNFEHIAGYIDAMRIFIFSLVHECPNSLVMDVYTQFKQNKQFWLYTKIPENYLLTTIQEFCGKYNCTTYNTVLLLLCGACNLYLIPPEIHQNPIPDYFLGYYAALKHFTTNKNLLYNICIKNKSN